MEGVQQWPPASICPEPMTPMSPLHPNATATEALAGVRKLLLDLQEQALNVAAETGLQPTAEEALDWAIAEVETMINRVPGS